MNWPVPIWWKEVQTAVTRDTEVGFHCRSCGYASQATIRTTGRGAGHSLYGVNKAGAAASAESRARDAVRYEADQVIAITSCPSCGRRNPYSLTKLRKQALWAVFVLAILGVFCVITWRAVPILTLVVGVLVVLAAAKTILIWKPRFKAARTAVNFHTLPSHIDDEDDSSASGVRQPLEAHQLAPEFGEGQLMGPKGRTVLFRRDVLRWGLRCSRLRRSAPLPPNPRKKDRAGET